MGGKGLHDCLRLPRLLTTNTQQLEILVTTLVYHEETERTQKCIDMHTAIPVRGNFNYPILFSLNNVLDDFSLSTR